jgi:hypothetical protein
MPGLAGVSASVRGVVYELLLGLLSLSSYTSLPGIISPKLVAVSQMSEEGVRDRK